MMAASRRRRWGATVGLVASLLAVPQVRADEAANKFADRLTGGAQRTWVKTRWENVLATEASCIQGEMWVFETGGRGTTKICLNGRTEESPLIWLQAGTADGLPMIELDGKLYVVDLRQQAAALEGEPPVLIAILRTVRTNQTEPVHEIWLEYRQR
jgi:hypothetical protein